MNRDEIRLEIQRLLEDGRKKLSEEVAAQLEKEKEAAIIEAKHREVNIQRNNTYFHGK